MQSAIFAVGDEPYIVWDEDVAARTRDFLEGLDPEFFSYLLSAYGATGDEKRASVAVRLALHHAAETLFSLVGALVQAPDCPYAWIAQCSNKELRRVVERISTHDETLISKVKLPGMGWDSVASVVFDTFQPETELQQSTMQGFGMLWGALAGEMHTEAFVDEHNAIKHGFRARPGGFKIEFAPVKTPDVPPTDAEMTLLGESKFGAMFYKMERLDGWKGVQLSSICVATNWSLQRDVLLLQLTQLSVHNVITRLKLANHFPPAECTFRRPGRDEDFNLPWSHMVAVPSATFGAGIDKRSLDPVKKADLLRHLRQATSDNVGRAGANRSPNE